jgi:phosphocarrier protein HPr
MGGMESQTFTIRNRLGLHARAAALLVKIANGFNANIMIEKDGVEVNGKSIMGILMLAASRGTKITVRVEGNDAAEALQTLGKLIENKFGEE